VLVVETKSYGITLVIDGVIQITERDEFAYQETIAHIPLFSHPNPQKVCIIGGGDGGVISQAIKHNSVQEIHLCEIDAVCFG
jgi:spermidine synthase